MVTPANPSPTPGPGPQQGAQPAQAGQQGQQPQGVQAMPQMAGVDFGKLIQALQKAGQLAPQVQEIVLLLVDALTARQGVQGAGPQKQAHPQAAAWCDDTVQCLCEALAHAVKARECCR